MIFVMTEMCFHDRVHVKNLLEWKSTKWLCLPNTEFHNSRGDISVLYPMHIHFVISQIIMVFDLNQHHLFDMSAIIVTM